MPFQIENKIQRNESVLVKQVNKAREELPEYVQKRCLLTVNFHNHKMEGVQYFCALILRFLGKITLIIYIFC